VTIATLNLARGVGKSLCSRELVYECLKDRFPNKTKIVKIGKKSEVDRLIRFNNRDYIVINKFNKIKTEKMLTLFKNYKLKTIHVS
jgi:hypothetical protein